jgi:L-cysteine S-thiosulfotransferase
MLQAHLLVLMAAALLSSVAAAQEHKLAQIQQGFALMHDPRSANCSACHSIADAQGRKSGVQSNFAPALDGVASRYSAAELRQWVFDARALRPDTRMPPYGVDLGYGQPLSAAQLEAVLAALASLK